MHRWRREGSTTKSYKCENNVLIIKSGKYAHSYVYLSQICVAVFIMVGPKADLDLARFNYATAMM